MPITKPALPSHRSAQAWNQACYGRTLSVARLQDHLREDPRIGDAVLALLVDRPHLLANHVVFLDETIVQSMARVIALIERVAGLSSYQQQALKRADPIAQHAWGPMSVCMGYDFHLSHQGPQLIEINTNAGGALLNLALAHAQQACCAEQDMGFASSARSHDAHAQHLAMFVHEWQLQRAQQPLQCMAIVDDQPDKQYLAPEFLLYQQLFQQHGIQARIVDARDLQWQDGALMHQGAVVDMVYNRLTDFYLSEPAHEAIRLAYEAGAVVLTPHPRAHALLADKRNLITLSDAGQLRTLGLTDEEVSLLQAHIPATQLLTPEHANALWQRRRELFFKPFASYGGKAAYRGDKLTKGVWRAIVQGGFVAQALVPPSQRSIELDGVRSELKLDIRAYTYAGAIQLLAARLYQGQTTNFRTPAGGFAPVITVPGAAT